MTSARLQQELGKKHPFDSPEQEALINLLRTNDQFQNQLGRVLRQHGLTTSQYNVLRILRGQKGEPIAVQSLAARMIDPSSNTSRIIDKLVEKGWTNRQVCPEDRRRADVSITPSGITVLTGLDAPINAMLSRSLSGVDETTRIQLNGALAHVLNNTDDVIATQN